MEKLLFLAELSLHRLVSLVKDIGLTSIELAVDALNDKVANAGNMNSSSIDTIFECHILHLSNVIPLG